MSDDDIRIGVFICHCGTNIGGVLDISELTEYAKTSIAMLIFIHVQKSD